MTKVEEQLSSILEILFNLENFVVVLEAVVQKSSVKKVFLKFSQSIFFNKVAGLRPFLLKKETQARVFSGEFCENSKDTFS